RSRCRPATPRSAAPAAASPPATTRSKATRRRGRSPKWRRRSSFPILAPSARCPLLELRHQADAAEAGVRYAPHHLHHRAVLDLPVAADENPLLRSSAAGLGDGLELCDQFLQREFGILEVDPLP